MDLFEFVIASARRAGDKLALRGYPFGWHSSPADPFDTVRDNQYQLDLDTGRTLIFMTFVGYAQPTATFPSPTGNLLSFLQLILKTGNVDVIPPEPEFDSGGALNVPSWMDIATGYEVNGVLASGAAAATPLYIQTVRGVVPLFKQTGPGNLLQIGSIKKLGVGVGDDWTFSGTIYTIKSFGGRP